MEKIISKDQVINNMCITYRHDFGLLSHEEQYAIKTQMIQIYDNNFIPVLKYLILLLDKSFKKML